MKNVRNHKDIKLATAEARKNHFESKSNYNTIKLSSNDLLAIEMKKKQILINKRVCLGLSIL